MNASQTEELLCTTWLIAALLADHFGRVPLITKGLAGCCYFFAFTCFLEALWLAIQRRL